MLMLRAVLLTFLAVIPTSTNYALKSYDFGNGSGTGSSSNYTLHGSLGGKNGTISSSTYALPAGIKVSESAAVPGAPTVTDPLNSYNKLHVVLSVSGMSSDTKYLIAISSDNFTTTNYVLLDDTVGSTASVANYQTYAAWGGAAGFDVLGLSQSTTYKLKVAALQGSGTGSAFGPSGTAATQAPSVTLSLQTSLTGTPPFAITLPSLTPGAVSSGNATITSTVTTNALNGGSILTGDQYGGLFSASKNATVASASADLSVASSGYGAQAGSATQTSGGPVSLNAPYNVAGNTVGALTTTKQPFASFAGPVTAGSATLSLMGKSNPLTPAANDYADVITISLSLSF
jgi:hypothetical protein